MWYIHPVEYYSSLKRKENLIHAAVLINLEDILLSEISQTQQTNIAWLHFLEVPEIMEFRDRKWLPETGGRVSEELVFNGYRVLIWDEKVVAMVSGNRCTKMGMYLMPLNCTL